MALLLEYFAVELLYSSHESASLSVIKLQTEVLAFERWK